MAKLDIDYQAITEVKDLQVSWTSQDNQRVHLRQTTLKNGLRYVTIHQEDGTQVFDECEMIQRSGIEVRELARVIPGTNLGAGFKLRFPHSLNKTNQETISHVYKTFGIDQKEIAISYAINPETTDARKALFFAYEITYPEQKVDQKCSLSRFIRVELKSKTTMDHDLDIKKEYNSISISYRLSGPFDAMWDFIRFDFDDDGKLVKVNNRASIKFETFEHLDEKTRAIIKNTEGELLTYYPNDAEAQQLSLYIFSKDITSLRLNLNSTFEALLESAINEINIDLLNSLYFE